MDEDNIAAGQKEVNAAIEQMKSNRRDRASMHFMNASAFFEKIEDPGKRRDELSILAMVLQQTGFNDLAMLAILDAVDIDRSGGDTDKLAEDLLTLGNANLNLGNVRMAMKSNTEALNIFLRKEDFGNAASANTNLAMIVANLDETDKAISMLKASIEYLEKKPHPDTEMITYILLIQLLGIRRQGPEELIGHARTLLQKYSRNLRRDQVGAIMPHLKMAVEDHLGKHPELDRDRWMREQLPWISPKGR